ncbi:pyridoxamine 5'-phosphate oxidase family protein [Kitasatospora sp. NPDC101183]|uniref:pyridoxamine 5'-phosphate oxidase family protein n=1 Tax=Kitasatospora sp. NPDC101183 TaxID=3364100 RepID=UPI0038049228
MNRDRDVEDPDLGPERALELLGRATVGRVVYTIGALPAVLPVPFRLGPGGVLLTTPADEELARAVEGAVIAFEADEVDDTDGSGWCVTVLGHAHTLPTAGALQIRIRPELVVGRRLP